MFIGEYYHNLDAKGRIIIPAKFRDELNGTFILTRGLDGCLTIYSTEKWEKIFEEINKLPETKKATRQYIRMLTANACECTLDNQGRILIPANLSGSVNITKECVVVGANSHVEIWDKATWNAYMDDASENFEDIAESLSDLIQ
ncbi:MAG: division/cell wall cluster transcriptional repressor MraZ [Solobacterium sp.]|nr:division/cell wall cluster transcriptional repressor MraZ [Erysipelotrichaceae bacterium]MCI6700591.1 division/cell wall cluster transcriptional repressor MraZ [Solobacterium sp.]MCI7732791.1 division/cell wall cluster transcriptional repressor MraZ [Solobacterium sp.]MDD5983714.1 division/cell wall cluster transcriptional repressor MraZ [Solobacterium sp.]MDD6122425.1 division/cell wall cluster transcriptional repressor MraZ [Solobacterium sp.]